MFLFWPGQARRAGEEVAEDGFQELDEGKMKGPSDEEDKHIPAVPRAKESAVPVQFYTAPRNCNPHNYSYIINQPSLCLDHKEVLLLVMIRSIFSHYDRRMAMRETWAMQENFKNLTVKFVFLFAQPSDTQIQRALTRESQIFDDIIQEDFEESYSNLTLKTVMAWKWAKTYCAHASFVMVGDDSIIVDTHKLVPYLLSEMSSETTKDHFTLCYLFPCCTRAIHGPSKYSVSVKKYPGSAYPAYCSGTAYVVSSDIITKLYLMSLDTPSFMPDDAWTGVLVEKLGLKFKDTFEAYVGISTKDSVMATYLHPSYAHGPIMIGILDYHFAGKEASMIRSLWRTIMHSKDQSILLGKFPEGLEVTQSPEVQTNNVWMFAVLLMFVDVGAIFFIFFMVFWRKRRKWGEFD